MASPKSTETTYIVLNQDIQISYFPPENNATVLYKSRRRLQTILDLTIVISNFKSKSSKLGDMSHRTRKRGAPNIDTDELMAKSNAGIDAISAHLNETKTLTTEAKLRCGKCGKQETSKHALHACSRCRLASISGEAMGIYVTYWISHEQFRAVLQQRLEESLISGTPR